MGKETPDAGNMAALLGGVDMKVYCLLSSFFKSTYVRVCFCGNVHVSTDTHGGKGGHWVP